MGLFDRLFGGEAGESTVTKQEAFAGILLAAAAADGQITEEETQGLRTAIERMKLFVNFTPGRFNQIMDNLLAILKKGGADLLLEKCVPAIPEELRETAFANACDILLADGDVEGEERRFLENLQDRLELDDDRAGEIVKVMVIKNRG